MDDSSISSFFSFTKTKPKKVGPAALVGGSAVIYTSLLQHPGSTLNQLSLILMMLLAVQYAVQPRLSRKYISPKVNKQSVALVEEVVKTGLAAVIFFLKPSTAVRSALKGKVVPLDGKKSMRIPIYSISSSSSFSIIRKKYDVYINIR